MSWTYLPDANSYRRHDGLVVYQEDGATTWSARRGADVLETAATAEDGRPARRRRRAWGKAERAMAALDGEMPAVDEQPPHPATQEDADRPGPTGAAAARELERRQTGEPVAPTGAAQSAAEQAPAAPATGSATPASPPAPARPPVRFEIPAGALARSCRGCGAPVYWITTAAGKAMPVDLDGVSHFATCPQAAKFRRPADEGRTGTDATTAQAARAADATDWLAQPIPPTPTAAGAPATPTTPSAAPAAPVPPSNRPSIGLDPSAAEMGPVSPADGRVSASTMTPSAAGNPAGPAAPASSPRQTAAPALPSPLAASRQQSGLDAAATGVGGACELLSDDDQAARHVELPGGRRVQRMTSSLVPMALGLSPHGGPYAAWALATGRMQGQDDNERLRLGRRYEAPARDEYRFRHPEYEVVRVRTLTREHWAADSPDGWCLVEGEPRATLEIKHRSRDDRWGMPGTDEVPPDVFAQALWHLWAAEVERCDVVLVVGLRYTEYVVRRSALLDQLVERAHDWWHRHVADDVEPPLDASPMTELAVRAVYAEATEPALEPSAPVLELARRRALWASREKEAANYKDLCDLALRKAMGACGGIQGVLTRYSERGRVDWKRLLQEHPELKLDAYRGEPTDKTRFIYKPPAEQAEAKPTPAKRAANGVRP